MSSQFKKSLDEQQSTFRQSDNMNIVEPDDDLELLKLDHHKIMNTTGLQDSMISSLAPSS